MIASQPSTAFAEALRVYQDGHFSQALEQLQGLLLDKPEGAQHWFALLGNVHFRLGNKEEAGDAFIREAELSPERAPAFLKLALTLYAQCGAREKIHRLATSALPHVATDPASVYVLAEVCQTLGDVASIRPMLPHLDPRNPQHVAIRCRYYRSIGDQEGLWNALCDGVRDCPGDNHLLTTRYAEARTVLNFDAMREYETIMQYPDTPLAQALLSGESAFQRLLWTRSEAVTALPSQDSNLLGLKSDALAPLRHPRRSIAPAGARLKIGYLSDDFRQHTLMSVFSEVLAHHDPARIDVTLFCHTPEKAMSGRELWPDHLQKSVMRIEDRPTVEVLDLIRHRGIDILVDLKGHTAGARLDIVNLADTPLKVSFLDYPACVTGAELDYAITDGFVTPESSRPFYVERLCLLPHTSMPNPTLESCMPQPASRADWGLPPEAFVFCSFNAVFKISPQTLRLWARVLQGAPHSLLWIRCDGALQRRNLLSALASLGIGRDRIHFAEAAASRQEHINRAALADVSLDTTPYNGQVTTTDMLRAGVPVVALRGTTAPARMSDGLLHAVGMPDLVADDEDAFVALATMLAREPALYRAVRDRLETNRLTSPLFQPALFARHLETAFAMMADRVRAGQSPDHISVPALDADPGYSIRLAAE